MVLVFVGVAVDDLGKIGDGFFVLVEFGVRAAAPVVEFRAGGIEPDGGIQVVDRVRVAFLEEPVDGAVQERFVGIGGGLDRMVDVLLGEGGQLQAGVDPGAADEGLPIVGIFVDGLGVGREGVFQVVVGRRFLGALQGVAGGPRGFFDGGSPAWQQQQAKDGKGREGRADRHGSGWRVAVCGLRAGCNVAPRPFFPDESVGKPPYHGIQRAARNS